MKAKFQVNIPVCRGVVLGYIAVITCDDTPTQQELKRRVEENMKETMAEALKMSKGKFSISKK